MDRKALLTGTAIGTVAQLAMILAGHFVPVIRDHVFAIGGMLISLLAGGLYARLARGGWGASLAGGAFAGGACALIGILVSAALGDTPAMVAVLGTCGSAVAGLAGGALARLLAVQSASPR